MHPLIEKNKEAINRLCKQHYIKNLYAFGSIINGSFSEESDIDFLYEIDVRNFPDWANGNYDYTDNLLSFEYELKNLLNRDIDLIPDLPVRNKYFKQTVEGSKQIVYAG